MIKQPCSQCSFEARLIEGRCPNCHYAAYSKYGRNSEWTAFVINAVGYGPDVDNPKTPKCLDCGSEDVASLKLVRRTIRESGEQQPLFHSASLRHQGFATEAFASPENFFLRCENCHDRFFRSQGRPRIVKTRAARRQRENERKIRYNTNNLLKVLELYPMGCRECGEPATRICYVGRPGFGPKPREHYKKLILLLKFEAVREDFAQFCAYHGVKSFAERVREARLSPRGEVLSDVA